MTPWKRFTSRGEALHVSIPCPIPAPKHSELVVADGQETGERHDEYCVYTQHSSAVWLQALRRHNFLRVGQIQYIDFTAQGRITFIVSTLRSTGQPWF